MASRRGHSPLSWKCRRQSRSAAARPSRQAASVGAERGSRAKKLRPVGSASRRARGGAPDGPGGTKRPSRARNRPSTSAAPLASTRGAITVAISCSTAAVRGSEHKAASPLAAPEDAACSTSASASFSSRSTVSPTVRHASELVPASGSGRGPSHRAEKSGARGSKPTSPRSAASARVREASPGSGPRGGRARAARSSARRGPRGERPKTCRPLRT